MSREPSSSPKRQRFSGEMFRRVGASISRCLKSRVWVAIGVIVAATLGVLQLQRGQSARIVHERGWLAQLKEDLERLPDTPANYLRVGQGEVRELPVIESLLFHSVILEAGSTLKLASELADQVLRARTVELHPGAVILGAGESGRPGEAGRGGANGGKCANGQDGTNGTSGYGGGKGVGLGLEALALLIDGAVAIDTSGGGGGAGGAGGSGGNGGRGDRSEGCDGGNGGAGGAGGDGGSGGSGGDLSIRFGELRSRSEESVDGPSRNDLVKMVIHTAEGGRSGSQGAGGAGGAGGRGRGANFFGVSAAAGSRGNNGQSGDRGEDGRSGSTKFVDGSGSP